MDTDQRISYIKRRFNITDGLLEDIKVDIDTRKCLSCNGDGYDHSGSVVDHMTPCWDCNGSGEKVESYLERLEKDYLRIEAENKKYKEALEHITENSEDKVAVFIAKKSLEN